jgi:hypothetical protein
MDVDSKIKLNLKHINTKYHYPSHDIFEGYRTKHSSSDVV